MMEISPLNANLCSKLISHFQPSYLLRFFIEVISPPLPLDSAGSGWHSLSILSGWHAIPGQDCASPSSSGEDQIGLQVMENSLFVSGLLITWMFFINLMNMVFFQHEIVSLDRFSKRNSCAQKCLLVHFQNIRFLVHACQM